MLGALKREWHPAGIAGRYEVNLVRVYQIRDCPHKTGQRSSLPMGGHRRSRIASMEQQIRAWIQAEADLTLAEICRRLAKHGVDIKVPALWHQIDKRKLTL